MPQGAVIKITSVAASSTNFDIQVTRYDPSEAYKITRTNDKSAFSYTCQSAGSYSLYLRTFDSGQNLCVWFEVTI